MDERKVGGGVDELRKMRKRIFDKRIQGYEPWALRGKEIKIKDAHYTFKEWCGLGGFGTVWIARTASGEEVAVKFSEEFRRSDAYFPHVIDKKDILTLSDEDTKRIKVVDGVQKLWREAAALKELGKEGSPYPRFIAAQFIPALTPPPKVKEKDVRMLVLVMEKIEGKELGEVVAEDGIQDRKRVLHFALQLAEAVKYTHDAGFVHCDIKPENILVENDDRIRLVDLGIVAFKNPKPDLFMPYQKAHEIIDSGAVFFMRRGEEYPYRFSSVRDVYSLGIVFIEMILGERGRIFFNARESEDYDTKSMFQEFLKKKRALQDELLQRLLALAERMTNKIPERRPTIEDVIREIGELRDAMTV